MMNGYSVTEAASVLGVPTERVWELLARGVLVGAPEGETGMRVFLQPRPAPAPVTAVPDDDPGSSRANGPEHEMSPFRELLTEFRNLTERYGQALLALGESRGEVASLRSRVDLLEARIDLRLPMGSPAATPWPTQPLPVDEALTAPPHPDAAVEEEEGQGEHRRRRRRGRRATESFAEALARAEDPSPADLPEATVRAESDAEDADRSLPRDVLPAEPVLVADEPETETTAAGTAGADPEPSTAVLESEQEPAAVAFEPQAEDAALEPQPEAVTLEPPAAEGESVSAGLLDDGWDKGWDDAVAEAVEPDEPAPPVEAVDSPELARGSEPASSAWMSTPEPAEPEPVGQADAFHEPEPADSEPVRGRETDEALLEVESIDVEPLPTPDVPEQEPISEVVDDPGHHEPAEAGDVAPSDEPVVTETADASDFDADRYTTVIEQPDWFEAEVEGETPRAAAGDAATADPAGVPQEPAPAEEPEAPEPAADGWQDAGDASPAPEEAAGPADQPNDGGADEMEVAGGGQSAVAPADDEPETGGLPGSLELDEALHAFGDLGPREEATGTAEEEEEEWPPAAGGADRFTPSAQQSAGYVRGTSRPVYGSAIPGSPATRAYRRLRRIFPT